MILVIAVVSNLGQFLYSEKVEPGEPQLFGGISGVLCGLFGYIWMKGLYEPEQGMVLHPNSVSFGLLWVALCMTGMFGPIANAAHVRGLDHGRRPGSAPILAKPRGWPARAGTMNSPTMIPEAPGAALIGGGFIGPVHVEALRRIGVRVVGLLGSSPERAQQTAHRLAIARVYRDLDDLLDDPEVGVVHVASPNACHFAQTKAVLESGRHVICEKPLAKSSQRNCGAPGAVALAAGPGRGRQLQRPLLPDLPRNSRAHRARRSGTPAFGHGVLCPGLAARSQRLQLASRARRAGEPAGRRRHRHALDGSGSVPHRAADSRCLRRPGDVSPAAVPTRGIKRNVHDHGQDGQPRPNPSRSRPTTTARSSCGSTEACAGFIMSPR